VNHLRTSVRLAASRSAIEPIAAWRIGVTDREQRGADLVVDEAVGIVVALALLVLHHAALLIELVLGDRAEQVAHAVAFHEQREVERAGRAPVST
jgi:hypothetical protein